MIGLMLVTLGIFALHPASAGAALYGGTWVPVASATAEYCLDGICAEHPADASIELAPPPSPEVLGQSRLTIGFGPLGFESFDVRFRNVEFVPVPEPSSACLIGLGLAALARRRRGSSVPAGPSELN